MKTCPYCAEEIQAAAIVCKHCRRELVTPPRRFGDWARGLLIAFGLLLVLLWVGYYNSDAHQQLRAFVAQREAWHRDCEGIIPETITPEMRVCADQLRALIATAKRHGWDEQITAGGRLR